MGQKKVVIIGAGPGGLTAGMILAHRGCDVTIVEKEGRVGGRNQRLDLDGFHFDLGPTFLMMKYVLDEVFELAGKQSSDYLDIYELDPMYRLNFGDFTLDMTADHEALKDRIAQVFPGQEGGLDAFIKQEAFRYGLMQPCLEKPYLYLKDMVTPPLTRALPHLSLGRSVYGNLGRYFEDERLRICFSFQAKYLGMSPWRCPAAFTIIPYVEHAYGIYHVRGGLCRISEAMARVVEEEGGTILLDTPVQEILVENKRATGVALANGKRLAADEVIVNADFSHAATHLFSPGTLKRYAPAKVAKKKFSCSTFMLYLGLDTLYQEPHHAILFAENYHANIEAISRNRPLPDDFSLYVRNASITDSTLAPEGRSAVYVLVPVANQRCAVNWEEEKHRIRRRVLDLIKARTSMKDIEDHIQVERMITPADWERSGVYLGATFNLAHTLDQMLYLRPRNKFEEVDHCYLVGGGTHPGSGLPTIYESGRIAANLIADA